MVENAFEGETRGRSADDTNLAADAAVTTNEKAQGAAATFGEIQVGAAVPSSAMARINAEDVETLGGAPSAPRAAGPPISARYEPKTMLAKGGMGEVWRFRDLRLGREVILKRLRGGQGDGSERRSFEGEAILQASLGHPGIVPVFDLGEDEKGETFFTMQEVKGTTLAEALDMPPTLPGRSPWSRRALLEVLARVCLTVAFAHERGILHLDLKPDNIMLGRFGEVYVLDWGIARKVAPSTSLPPGSEKRTAVGTPQYMSPEQARGEETNERSDVFALGAILFEILTGEMLRKPGAPGDLLKSAQRDPEVHQRLQDAKVPLELARLCADATAMLESERIAHARKLNESLERWLDGERDFARRRVAAQEMTQSAHTAYSKKAPLALVLRQLSQAVALDPNHEPALKELANLIVDAAASVPEGAKQQLERENHRLGMRTARVGLFVYSAWLLILPVAISAGLKAPLALMAILVPALSSIILSAIASKKGWTPTLQTAIIVSSHLTIAGFAGAFGPLLVLPGLIIANTFPMLQLVAGNRKLGALVLGCGLMAFIGPLSLEWLGVLPPSYAWQNGAMIILPRMLQLGPGSSTLILIFTSLMVTISNHFLIADAVSQQISSRRSALSQAFVLRDLLPDALRAVAPKRAEPGALSPFEQ